MFHAPVSAETDSGETASRPAASVQPSPEPAASVQPATAQPSPGLGASQPLASRPVDSPPLDSPPLDSPKKCPDALAAEITALAGHLNAAQYRFLKLLDEFDRGQGWVGSGARSLAHWLEWKCGLGGLAAREKVRVARALRELPLIDAAFGRGEISYSKVRAMTRAAAPENEEELLNIARYGTAAHMERLVRVYRRCRGQAGASPGETALRREERFYCFAEDDETMVFGGRVSVEQGRLLIKALDAMVTEMEADEREGDDGEPEAVPETADIVSAETSVAASEPDVSAETSDVASRPIVSAETSEVASGPIVSAETSEVASGPIVSAETSEIVSAETSVTGFGASGSSDTSAPASGRRASGRSVSAETSTEAPESIVSAKTSVEAPVKNVSAETLSEAKSDAKSDAKSEAKPDAKSDAKSETKSEAKSDAKPEAKSDAPPFKPLRVRRATALAQIAEHYLATRRRGTDATPLRSSDAWQVFVHVNANDAHPDNRINAGHTTYTDDRRSLAPHVARQLACDASRRTVLENERGEVLNIGRRSRIVPWHIAHALRIRDGGCRFPGCSQHRWTDAHHIHHWADGGETSLENLVTLCRHHHRALHRDEYRIEHGADGELIFIDPRTGLFHRPSNGYRTRMAPLSD